jgi:uncharacterized protein
MHKLLLIPALALSALTLPAQATNSAPTPPQIHVQGVGRIEVAPDRAELLLAVETRAATGAQAGRDNARIIAAVLDTLRKGFGLTDRDLSTRGYQLQPQMSYPREGPPKVTGYQAMNMVMVRTRNIDRAGAIIDAALSKGATNVAGLQFTVADSDGLRRRALSLAVEQAQRDAQAMAEAAGGKLGQLIELVHQDVDLGRSAPVMMAMAVRAEAADVPTPIQAGEQTVTARVSARWVFIPGR